MPVFGRRLQFWTSTLLYFFVLLFGPQVVTATAQEPVGRLEAYGAYSLLRPNLPAGLGGDPAIERFLELALSNVLGWNGGVTLNVTPTFGITGDVSGYYRSAEVTSQGEHVTGDLKVHTFLFGPRFRRPGETWRPFAHAL